MAHTLVVYNAVQQVKRGLKIGGGQTYSVNSEHYNLAEATEAVGIAAARPSKSLYADAAADTNEHGGLRGEERGGVRLSTW